VTRRSLLVAAGWLGAAVVAVLVGLAAISVIGTGLMSSNDGAPRSEAEVAREVAALPPRPATPTPSPSPSVSASLGARPASKSFPTRAGTVVAVCSAAGAEIVMSPYSGFTVHEQTQGAQRQAEGEFRGSSDDKDRVKVSVTCPGGVPAMTTRSRRD
jgi:hypothetical protein